MLDAERALKNHEYNEQYKRTTQEYQRLDQIKEALEGKTPQAVEYSEVDNQITEESGNIV